MLRKVRDLQDDFFGELQGTEVFGQDKEKLGTVDDALLDDRTGDLRYLLVNA